MKRLLALAAMTVGGGLLLNAGLASRAQAAGCYYGVMQHGVGMIGITGNGHAAKKEWACNRARRECNRLLERARKQARLPRGGPRDFRCERYGP
jgi:hypothetical protein